MKADRPYPTCAVTPKAEAAILKGHPWVYADEITAAPDPAPENGGVVDVLSRKGRYLGSGLWSEASKIRVRLLSRNANDRFDESFWRRRIEYAWAYRKAIYPPQDLQCCRVVFGEADGLPGLTVDRFGPILSVQILSFGMDQRKELLARLLVETLAADGEDIRGVFLRNDVGLREKEGLAEGKGWLEVPGLTHPEKAETIITENGVRYHVDAENGQKTGFFLDQKLNRRRVAQLSKGRRVLDCFTHTGSFALNAALGGAEHVTAVDVSEAAVEMARENAVLNGLADRMDFVCADVFDLLPSLEGKHDYDFIILDPPAFTKARRTAANAMRGYKEINYRAMKLLLRGGLLATASCSHFATPAMFEKMLAEAALDAGRQLRQIEARQQAPDHPILWNVEETGYLKFYLFQVV